jgi:hypothetical protein
MKTPVVAHEVRYRQVVVGDFAESAWMTKTFPVGENIDLEELARGVPYELQIRAVGANGNSSEWVDGSALLALTNRVGAAALPNIGNQQSMWDLQTSVTFAASTDGSGSSVATISVTAGDLIIGSVVVSYAASSATVTGAAGEKVTLYLYYHDPLLQGGSRLLNVTTNIVETANVNGNVAVSSIEFTFPPAGGSSSGGGSIGGGGGSGGIRNPPYTEVPV